MLSLSQRLEVMSYQEGPYTVLTEHAHLKRGWCCGSGCRHCPFSPKAKEGSTDVTDEIRKILLTSSFKGELLP